MTIRFYLADQMKMWKRSSRWTIKEKCREYYDSYEWEKWAFSWFYQKVTHNPWVAWEELIVQRKPVPYKYKPRVYEWRYPELYKYYNSYPNPEVRFWLFLSRVKDGWYPKEIAITNWKEWEEAREKKAKSWKKDTKSYTATYSRFQEEEKQNDDDFFIKITYPKEVAEAFLKEYDNLLEDLEYQLTDILDKESRNKIEADILRIKTEIMVFKCYNDM